MPRILSRLFLVFSLIALTLGALPESPRAQAQAQPEKVVVPGTFQTQLGCPANWQPDCDATALRYDEIGDIWIATFKLEAGEYEYKVALNGSWDENYGAKAERNGANIKLSLPEAREVTFFYSRQTNWIADNVNAILANVPGSFQSEIGCPNDWMPSCLRTLLQDPDGDGKYMYVTSDIPEGAYEAKVALNLSWALNYGARGARDGANIGFTSIGKEIAFIWDSETKVMSIEVAGAPKGDLNTARAHWVLRDLFVWNAKTPDPRRSVFRLHYAPEGGIRLEENRVSGGESVELKYVIGVDSAVTRKFPHLNNSYSLQLPPELREQVPQILKGQIALSVTDAEGALLDATGVQIPGVLDDLYTYGGVLGVSVPDSGLPFFALWAPTARSVTLHLFEDSNPETTSTTYPMEYDAAQGVWTYLGEGDWLNKFYLYEVEVYVPSTRRIERNLVTDPYSVSLSLNSQRSQIVDIYDPALMPNGWQTLQKPPLAAPEDIVVYELHIRDFSIIDQSVPEALRGTYLAFTNPETNGMRHLKALQEAGLTHVHLLPFFDIATIEEDRRKQVNPDFNELAAFPPDSDRQQAIIYETRDQDGFNWGYDPFHYNVPEGSYAVEADGSGRIREVRQMVQSLNNLGLRVVMDVVYNHTNAAGQSEKSVLDRIVPGYYHRLNEDGRVETSTCCPNTATEHAMMERLMVDSVVFWATHYKIDGFRFDLMGHHMLSNMRKVRAALDALTLEEHGVDGKAIYIYGEGWNFGEVANNARGVNATQLNIGGTGIGTFNDRIRDAIRGGNPFGDREKQGFSSGLFTNPNDVDQTPREAQLQRLLLLSDHIRIGLAGNLRDFKFINAQGREVTGRQVLYNGQPTGYTRDPQENIVYTSKHDNETIFDLIQYKAPLNTSMADRVRMNTLALSLVMFAQGVPFFHAGDDMLRSKSLDRDSYNSGDWFNAIDWTFETTNWGKGLPVAEKNQDMWEVMRPLLANPDLKPTPDAMRAAHERFKELLQIRRSSPLFRLRTAEDVQARLAFHNTGAEQVPGLIVMSLSDMEGEDLDPNHSLIVVLFNNAPEARTFTVEALKGMALELHPVQANGGDDLIKTAAFDPATGTFTVPPISAAVFVVRQ